MPLVVAINKMDLPGANPERVKKDLAALELVPEEWGGDTIMVPVSARTKAGRGPPLGKHPSRPKSWSSRPTPPGPAVGTIIEAKLEKGRGPVATVLVQEGTLRTGDAVVTGTHYGRVRALMNGRGQPVKEVLPGYSAEVVGLSGVPTAGDTINVRRGREGRQRDCRPPHHQGAAGGPGEDVQGLAGVAPRQRTKAGESKELRVVIKGDVQGSVEAVAQALDQAVHAQGQGGDHPQGRGRDDRVRRDARRGVSKGTVVGFNVKPESGSEAAAKAQGVAIHTYSIIYELIDGVRKAMEGMLEPIRTEKRLGRAEVRNLFNVPKLGTIAGCGGDRGYHQADEPGAPAPREQGPRDGQDGEPQALQGRRPRSGAGLRVRYRRRELQDLKAGDIIEAYEIEETRPSLE